MARPPTSREISPQWQIHPWCMVRRPTRTQECGSLTVPIVIWGPALSSSYYEIRVVGILPPEILLDFERLSASVKPVETILHGPLRDQAALHGLLARLQTFGVQVVEVRRLHDPDPQSPEPPVSEDRPSH
jgi:hypothetical protein